MARPEAVVGMLRSLTGGTGVVVGSRETPVQIWYTWENVSLFASQFPNLRNRDNTNTLSQASIEDEMS